MHLPLRLPATVRRGTRLFACALMLGGLLACGYKGPLYMPPPDDPPPTLTTPPGHATPPGPTAN